MNIVILRTGTSNFGKVGTYNVQEVGLAKALMKRGHVVNVLYLNRETEKIIDDEEYSYVHYLPHKRIGLHGIFDVHILGNYHPDRVILFSDNQLWAKNVINWCKKGNIPIVHYFGAVLSNNNRWLNKAYTKVILLRNRSSYKYSINASKTADVKNEMEINGIHCDRVINIGLDETILSDERNLNKLIRNELGLPEDKIILLYIGRFSDDKRPLAACDVLKEMIHQDVDCQLIMIGKGNLESDLKKYISKLKIETNVKIIPSVPYEEIYKYFVACDCCINMSHVEIFGMTILESMYYGLPIVAHVAPGPNEIIEDGVSGFLCNTDDTTVWVKNIRKAISNRNFISKNAHNRIVNHFTWDIIANDFLLEKIKK